MRRILEPHAQFPQTCEHIRVLVCPRHMEVLHLPLRRRVCENAHHRLVDGARAAAAARDEHRLFPGIKAEGRRPLRTGRRQHLRANGIARHDGFFLRKHTPGILHAHGNRRRKMRKQTIRHARAHILLLHERRHARKARRKQNRSRDIPACANRDVGTKRPDNAARTHERTQRTPRAQDILKREPPLKSRKIDRCEVDALARHDVRLKPVRRPDVEDAHARNSFFDRTDDRKRGIDMPARAAARYDDVHSPFTILLKSHPRSS